MVETVSIYKTPSKVLRKISEPVTNFGELRLITIPRMQEAMANEIAMGIMPVGISAVQIGVHKRVFVTDMDNEFKVYCNPTILKKSKKTVEMVEGCLSYENSFILVKRHQSITVRYQNEHGETIKEKLSDMAARVFQHELDHLNGVLMIDHAIVNSTMRKLFAQADKDDEVIVSVVIKSVEEPLDIWIKDVIKEYNIENNVYKLNIGTLQHYIDCEYFTKVTLHEVCFSKD